MKTRVKKCLNCFKQIPVNTTVCPDCGFVFRSAKKRNWKDKIRDFFIRAGNKRIG